MSKITQLRFRAKDKDIFEAVKSGKKKVETRAATIKFSKMNKGDKIKCVCGKKYFEKEIKKVSIFKTVQDLLKKYKVKDINPSISATEDLIKMYYGFPGYKEKIKKYGLIALELK